MNRKGLYIDSRHYNDITQRTIDGSRTERKIRECLKTHLMLGG